MHLSFLLLQNTKTSKTPDIITVLSHLFRYLQIWPGRERTEGLYVVVVKGIFKTTLFRIIRIISGEMYRILILVFKISTRYMSRGNYFFFFFP